MLEIKYVLYVIKRLLNSRSKTQKSSIETKRQFLRLKKVAIIPIETGIPRS